MRYYYLKIFALIVGNSGPVLAQDLPATIRARPHNWYAGGMVAAWQPQRFESNNSLIQPKHASAQLAWGLMLGYSHSLALAIETGILVVPSYSGFRLQAGSTVIPFSANTRLYVPAQVVVRVWEPTPRLAVRAMIGGAIGLNSEGSSGGFNDTLSVYGSGTNGGRILARVQGSTRGLFYAATAGLRAEYPLSKFLFIGAEIQDVLALGKAFDEKTISATNDGNPGTVAIAQMSSRQHTLSAGINVRFTFGMSTKYRYQSDLQEVDNRLR